MQGFDVPSLVHLSEEDVLESLDRRMCRQFHAVLDVAWVREISVRMSACVLGLERIAAAAEALGTARLFNGG